MNRLMVCCEYDILPRVICFCVCVGHAQIRLLQGMHGDLLITHSFDCIANVACRLQGKILFELREYQASGTAYKSILRLQPSLLPAWKGLAELYTTTSNDAELVGVFESLVSVHSVPAGKVPCMLDPMQLVACMPKLK